MSYLVNVSKDKKSKKSYLQRIWDDEEANQRREVGMFLKSSDYDEFDEVNKFLRMASNPAKSEKQARFMRACAHGAHMNKKCPPKHVARKFMHT